MAQHCPDCGKEVRETDSFCKSCGKQLFIKKKEKEKAKGKSKFHLPLAIKGNPTRLLVIGVVAFLLLMGLYLLTSETRTVAVSVPYQEPVYETKTVEESVPYQEAVYGTVYSGKVGNYGFTGQTWTISNAISYTKEYTGEGFWGSEYQFTICWVSNCQNYYKIQFWDLQPSTIITGYETKYKPEYKNVREVVRYDTKYRTEYKEITKTRIDWLLGR